MNNGDVKAKGGLRFQATKPLDKSDPGFRILGHKLHWVAAHQTENRMDGLWRIIKKDELPAEFLAAMKQSNRDMFGSDNTIRNKELVLAYASQDAVDERNAEARLAANHQMNLVTSKAVPGGNKHMRVDEAELTKVSSAEFFNN